MCSKGDSGGNLTVGATVLPFEDLRSVEGYFIDASCEYYLLSSSRRTRQLQIVLKEFVMFSKRINVRLSFDTVMATSLRSAFSIRLAKCFRCRKL